MWCSVCTLYESRLNGSRNFSRSFIDGITDPGTLKRDQASKHRKSEQHLRAMGMHTNPFTRAELYRQTAIGKCLVTAETEDRERVDKLVDICYMMAREEIAFSKFPSIAKLEIRHKVALGQTYLTELKCKEITELIGTVMETDFLSSVKKAQYMSVLSDGSTDVTNVEKELFYVTFVVDALVTTRLLAIRDVKHADAAGLTELLLAVFEWANIDVKKKLVGFCADGANVNLGRAGGVAVRLAREIPAPWLVVIHCVSHRFELAVKDTFKGTGADTVIDMLVAMHFLYEKSNKRLRELNTIGEMMEEHIRKPAKANGTRWVQHKSQACTVLHQNYAVIVAHLEAQAAEGSTVPAADKARLQGYLKTLKSLKFVLYLLYMKVILASLGEICKNLQKASIDLLYVSSCLVQLNTSLDVIREAAAAPTAATLGPLADVLREAEDNPNEVTFKGVQLCHGGAAVVNAFKVQMTTLADKLKDCMVQRFRDIEHDDKIRCLKLLNTTTWPRQQEDLAEFGDDILASFIDAFRPLLEANNVDIDELHREWSSFKMFWLQNLAHLSRSDLWETVMKHYSDTYPNFIHVINVLMVFPGT